MKEVEVMKKEEMFNYMLFAVTLFTSITMFHFWGMNVITSIVTMLLGMSFTNIFMFHGKDD
jgi:hypothetical protein